MYNTVYMCYNYYITNVCMCALYYRYVSQLLKKLTETVYNLSNTVAYFFLLWTDKIKDLIPLPTLSDIFNTQNLGIGSAGSYIVRHSFCFRDMQRKFCI